MVVYYAVIYLKDKKNELTEIQMKPYLNIDDAKECVNKIKEMYGERVIHTKVRRTDLSKNEFWL